MNKPTFSVITTAKNETDKKLIEETFENWEITKELFEKSTNRKIEFVVVDAGNNIEFPVLKDCKMIDSKSYENYRGVLEKRGKIKYHGWDTPSIGRNLGFRYSNGIILVFQDIDTLFSTGTDLDFEYINPNLDRYENYFSVMYDAFRRKGIVAAAPSSRARDSKKIGRRFGIMGENYTVWFSTKIRTFEINDMLIAGPSVPGFNISVLRNTASRIYSDYDCLYDPELAVAEDHKFSRIVGKYGKVSYERDAGVFVRTVKRVSPGFDLLKSILYALMWIVPYSNPDLWKYRKHSFTL